MDDETRLMADESLTGTKVTVQTEMVQIQVSDTEVEVFVYLADISKN